MADSSSDSIDVTYVADLARLRLSPEEIATFQKQLGDVLGYVSQLKEVDVSHVSLLGEADLKNRLRSDDVQPSLTPGRGAGQRASAGEQPFRRTPDDRIADMTEPDYPRTPAKAFLWRSEAPRSGRSTRPPHRGGRSQAKGLSAPRCGEGAHGGRCGQHLAAAGRRADRDQGRDQCEGRSLHLRLANSARLRRALRCHGHHQAARGGGGSFWPHEHGRVRHGLFDGKLLLGRTRNPWDLDRIPGGSSGGSAAAVGGHRLSPRSARIPAAPSASPPRCAAAWG